MGAWHGAREARQSLSTSGAVAAVYYCAYKSMLLCFAALLLAAHGAIAQHADREPLRYSAWVWGDDCVTRGQEHWGEKWVKFFDGLRAIGVEGPGRRLYVSAGHIVANTSGFQNFFEFTRAASEQGLGVELLFVQRDPWNVGAEKMVAQAELSCTLITACRAAGAGAAECPVAIHYDLVRAILAEPVPSVVNTAIVANASRTRVEGSTDPRCVMSAGRWKPSVGQQYDARSGPGPPDTNQGWSCRERRTAFRLVQRVVGC